MVYASGIHLDTIFSENNGEYGEFVFLVESVIQGSQETSNVKSNIDENVFWAIIFPELLANWNKWYPWHFITSYWGFFLVMIMHK